MKKNDTKIDPNKFIGLSLQDANNLAISEGLISRISKRGTKSISFKKDFRSDRINFEIEDKDKKDYIAGAYYGVPDDLWNTATNYLDDTLMDIYNLFDF